ncbi:hypothetical protein lerEdw1_008688 [Lerista edwardsae]|nr:hypothetical protein lerEdw1_008688 [Lerista edwardsae]
MPTRRAFKIQCGQDGTWLEGACMPVTCDPPPSKFHGLYQCTNGFQFNSECKIKCEEDGAQSASNVILCRKDGTWSGAFHLCRGMEGDCPLPAQLNGGLNLHCPDGYGIGTAPRGSLNSPPPSEGGHTAAHQSWRKWQAGLSDLGSCMVPPPRSWNTEVCGSP